MGFLYDEAGETPLALHKPVGRKIDSSHINEHTRTPSPVITNVLDMAEGGAPQEPKIPLIPPPPPSPHRTTSVSEGEAIHDIGTSNDINQESAENDNATFEPVDIAEEVLQSIENKLDQLEEIPDICDEIPIECFQEHTQHNLCYLLDPESETLSDSELSKDYLGFGEWIGLETLFMRYLHRTPLRLKTIEVLGKWITLEGDPRPTIGNFKNCMINGLDRPDVIMELAKHITRDAIAWVRTGAEACTVPQTKTDKSWQLTRHDVVTGKKTYYTCCLVYADEDEGMAQIITKLYKSVWKEALFFLPQFDLKIGKYEFDTTAKVIQERCEGRVIFILSEYFFASEVCRFSVHFSRAIDAAAEAGNLIPFHLTNKYDHVPRVLKGIAGIRWFRRPARKMSWTMITDTILGGRLEEKKLETLKSRMLDNIDRAPSEYLCDPPYDENTPSPGPPIVVHDPPLSEELCKYDPVSYPEQCESDALVSACQTNSSKLVKMYRDVKKRLAGRLGNLFKRKRKSKFQKPDEAIDLDEPICIETTPDPNSTFYDVSKLTQTETSESEEQLNTSKEVNKQHVKKTIITKDIQAKNKSAVTTEENGRKLKALNKNPQSELKLREAESPRSKLTDNVVDTSVDTACKNVNKNTHLDGNINSGIANMAAGEQSGSMIIKASTSLDAGGAKGCGSPLLDPATPSNISVDNEYGSPLLVVHRSWSRSKPEENDESEL